MRKDLETAIEEAKNEKRIVTFAFKGAIDLIDKNLLDTETVKYVIGSNIGILTKSEALNIKPFNFKNKTAGILVITSKRLFHCSQLLFNKKVEQILFDDINNIESKGNLLASVLRVQSVTNIMEIDISNKEVTPVTKLIQELKEQGKTVSVPNVNAVSQADELAKFKKLLDDGVLTAEEFEKKKIQILGL
jgi:hypothetical protein